MEKPKYKPEHVLMEAIGFTEEDLEANRQGYLTKKQCVHLNKERSKWLTYSLVAAGVGFYFIVRILLDDIPFYVTVPNKVPIIGIILVFAGTTATHFFWKSRRFGTDLRNGETNFTEGRVQLDVDNAGRRDMYYTLAIQDIVFRVKKRAFLAFKNGDPYCIYYAPHSKTILSAEWLREESP